MNKNDLKPKPNEPDEWVGVVTKAAMKWLRDKIQESPVEHMRNHMASEKASLPCVPMTVRTGLTGTYTA